MREIVDRTGQSWEVIAAEESVAHLRRGARLAFRRAGEETGPPLPSAVTFNSREAAEAAIRSMSDGELERRLILARKAVGGE